MSEMENKIAETRLERIRNPKIDISKKGIKKKKRGKSSADKIQMYKLTTIIEIWAFTLTIGVVAISGLFLMRDWLFLNFGVYGDKFIPTPEGIQDIHIWFGYVFAVLGLFHVIIHIFSNKKDILSKQTLLDFKGFLHSGMYLIGFARREEYRNTEGRFTGRQRIIYISLVYILGLTTITGLLYYLNFLPSGLSMVHVVPAGLSIMVLLFHFLITLRKHDSIALKATFFARKLPNWYVRKNHPIWYKELISKRKTNIRRSLSPTSSLVDKISVKGNSDLINAVSKFILLLDENPDESAIKVITEELQKDHDQDELQRIIELADQLEDKVKVEDKVGVEDKEKVEDKVKVEDKEKVKYKETNELK